ncbi:Mbeg1-like protein [Luteimonas sp. 22616]|uniref:Mbeg1-like protein n=1 Tax=Luteimonas sp. 22616 TaxID=3453951 RepID=UPI003F84AC03
MLIAQESAPQSYISPLLSQANLLQGPRLQPFQPADTYPKGDGTFSGQAAGTQPQADLDQQLAMMSNDAYAADNPKTEQALQDAGWNRLEPNEAGNALVDAQGREIPIDPALLSTGNGFDAAIYQNDQGQYVVAYRGTDNWGLTNPGDADDNGLQGLGFETGQYSDAIALAQRAEQVFGDGNVVVTGHSLGGGLASAAALATGASGVTFNAAGLSNETLESLGFNPNAVRDSVADNGQLRRYIVNGDPLNGAQQDIPILPIIPVSPPNALGHELRVDPPAGIGFDLAKLHGGGGDGASYVDALAQNTPYDPADRPTLPERAGTAVNDGLDVVGDQAGNLISDIGHGADRLLDGAGSLLRGNPILFPGGWVAGTVLDGAGALIRNTSDLAGAVVDGGLDLLGNVAEPVIGFTGNVGRDALENLGEFNLNQLGNLARQGTDLFNDVRGNVSETVDGISDAVNNEFAKGDLVEGTFDVVGSVLDGGIDTLGDAASSLLGFGGDSVQNATNAGGNMLRDLGEELGLETPFDAVAGFVEGTGKVVSDVADGAGKVVDTVTDVVGDGVEAVSGFVGDVGQGISDVAGKINPLKWF